MVKIIGKILKKIMIAFFILYSLNVMLSGTNFYIPINIITISVITLLGIPGVLGLITILFIV